MDQEHKCITRLDRLIVMMVDDDDMTRMMGLEHLTQAGFTAVQACDGQQALDAMEALHPDIILLDVEMPRLDGYATCRKIRQMQGHSMTPILMLTGLEDAASIDLAYEAGATDFATKPINWLLLCHRIRYMLRGSNALEDLRQSRVSLATAQRIALLGNWTWSVESNTTTWSDQLYRIVGEQRGHCRPEFETILKRVPEQEKAKVTRWFRECMESELPMPISHGLIFDDGTERHVRQQLEIERDSRGVAVRIQAAVQDITEHHRAKRKIHQLAYYDGLTALPNRSLFGERLDLALGLASRHERSLAVMFIDLDDFKRVNDTLGHANGDLLLQNVGERLKTCLRSSDALGAGSAGTEGETIARMGGDEFTVLLSEIRDEADAVHVAGRILAALSKPYDLAGNEVFTTPSVGISVYPQHGETAEQLLKNADMAMYFAKREGKNVFRTFDASMTNVAMDRYSMEAQLRKALDGNELSLNYQPQMNLATGGFDAVEALLRWNSTELGFVSPADFIPLAEETGLIVPIGEWVLRTACRQAVSWRAEGLKLERMAVNISVLQFVRPDFPRMVMSILEETGLEASRLELEITESVLAKDTTGAVSTLRTLKEVGVQLSIDDFGTGYSSLSQLKHFPIDRLKIDRSFVMGVTDNRHDAAITKAVLAMANSMELLVIAEGVETEEQLSFLQGNHCDEVQGYFLSRPLPAREVEETLRMARHASLDMLSLKKTG